MFVWKAGDSPSSTQIHVGLHAMYLHFLLSSSGEPQHCLNHLFSYKSAWAKCSRSVVAVSQERDRRQMNDKVFGGGTSEQKDMY
jgi:hypothetical protein